MRKKVSSLTEQFYCLLSCLLRQIEIEIEKGTAYRFYISNEMQKCKQSINHVSRIKKSRNALYLSSTPINSINQVLALDLQISSAPIQHNVFLKFRSYILLSSKQHYQRFMHANGLNVPFYPWAHTKSCMLMYSHMRNKYKFNSKLMVLPGIKGTRFKLFAAQTTLRASSFVSVFG